MNPSRVFKSPRWWFWTIVILIVVLYRSFGQLPVIPSGFNFPPKNTGDPDPTTIPGLAYYWNSADLPSSGLVSNWVDRIQGLAWTNGAGSTKWPSGSALGVLFDGTNSKLTNAMNFTTLPGTLNSAFIVVKCLRTSNIADGFWTDLAGNSNQGVDWSSGTVAVPSTLSAYWAQPVNVIQDWLIPLNRGASQNAYTNNVVCRNVVAQIFTTSVGFALGATQAGGAPGNFVISVMCIYTNSSTDIIANSSFRATLHKWATNDSPSKPFAP